MKLNNSTSILKTILAGGALGWLSVSMASAHLDLFGSADIGSSQANEAAYFTNTVYAGSGMTFEFLAKFENESNGSNVSEGTDHGFTVPSDLTDNSTAELSWDLTGSGFEVWGVLVKSGKQGGADSHNVYTVSPDQRIVGGTDAPGVDFVESASGQDISHITFIGKPGGTVPDGGSTAILLGSACLFWIPLRKLLKRLS